MNASVNNMSVRLQAIGTYIPDQRIDNQLFLSDFDLGIAFLEEKLGIFGGPSNSIARAPVICAFPHSGIFVHRLFYKWTNYNYSSL